MRIHLVTYATRRFRVRQLILGWSARLNGVVDTVTHWTPDMLLAAGFEERCKDIKLTERGSGYWAWKPFIIEAKLHEVPEGDIVFYCDVGRIYPFKMLDQPIAPYLEWMECNNQDVMPGILIPWDGSNSTWIKREALIYFNLDRKDVHEASPVQASFSFWRSCKESRRVIARWLTVCSKRSLISDDPSRHGLMEYSDFREHRHDQALLTLCCIEDHIRGLDIGVEKPEIDSRNPSHVSRLHFGENNNFPKTLGFLFRIMVRLFESLEKQLRRKIKFGVPVNK